jgi:hypothetical protein
LRRRREALERLALFIRGVMRNIRERVANLEARNGRRGSGVLTYAVEW